MCRAHFRPLLWLTIGFGSLQILLFTPYSLVGFFFLGWVWMTFFQTQRVMRAIRLNRSLSRTRLFVHESFGIRLSIHNDRSLSIPLEARMVSSVPGLVNKEFPIVAMGNKETQIDAQGCFYTRGVKRLGTVSLHYAHPLGLFEIFRTDDLGDSVIVFPRVEPLFFRKEVLREIIYGRKTPYPMLEDTSRLSHLQEYDHQPMHRIHWKLSARMNQLMAKEFEKTALGNVTLLVDLNLPRDIVINQAWKQMRVVYEDVVVDAAASLIEDLKGMSVPVRLVIVGEKITESQHPRADYVPYLEDLTRARGCERPEESMVEYLRGRMMTTTMNDTVVILCMHISSSEVPLLMKVRARSAKVVVLIMPYGYRSSSTLPSRSYGMPHPDLREMLRQAHILMENGVIVRFLQENDALQEAVDHVP